MARVEPDLADGLDGRHARERDLHLAEEVGRARVSLGDVLRKNRKTGKKFEVFVAVERREGREKKTSFAERGESISLLLF